MLFGDLSGGRKGRTGQSPTALPLRSARLWRRKTEWCEILRSCSSVRPSSLRGFGTIHIQLYVPLRIVCVRNIITVMCFPFLWRLRSRAPLATFGGVNEEFEGCMVQSVDCNQWPMTKLASAFAGTANIGRESVVRKDFPIAPKQQSSKATQTKEIARHKGRRERAAISFVAPTYNHARCRPSTD